MGLVSKYSKNANVFLWLIILVAVAYANTLNTSWHLDDLPNILDNKHIRSVSWSPDTWLQAIRSPLNPEQSIYRLMAMLTFAANWKLGGQNVLGYHLVNTGIHNFPVLFA